MDALLASSVGLVGIDTFQGLVGEKATLPLELLTGSGEVVGGGVVPSCFVSSGAGSLWWWRAVRAILLVTVARLDLEEWRRWWRL